MNEKKNQPTKPATKPTTSAPDKKPASATKPGDTKGKTQTTKPRI